MNKSNNFKKISKQENVLFTTKLKKVPFEIKNFLIE